MPEPIVKTFTCPNSRDGFDISSDELLIAFGGPNKRWEWLLESCPHCGERHYYPLEKDEYEDQD
jgi:hypothetical protein